MAEKKEQKRVPGYKSENQKYKSLLVMQYILKNADDEHAVTMKEVKELLTAREWEKEFKENVDMDNYTKRVFSMFGGKRERVTIRFIDQRLDTVVDQFGIAGVKYENLLRKFQEKHR